MILTNLRDLPWHYSAYYGVELGTYERHCDMLSRPMNNAQSEQDNTVLEGYEPLTTTGEAKPPWWDLPGPDFAAELAPLDLHSEIEWHYELLPRDDDPNALVDRAREIRDQAAAVEPATAPDPEP